ncbi:MAG: hypothetical protein AAGI23_00500 [Bacteroidota bacterium]
MENQALRQQIEHIRHLMAEGKIEAAVTALRTLSATLKDSATKDEIISISSRFKRLERSIRDQMVSVSDINIKQNQLTGQMLSLLSSLEKGYATVAQQTNLSTTSTTIPEKKKSSPLKWMIPLLAVLVLGGLGYYFFRSSGDVVVPVDECAADIQTARVAYREGDYEKAERVLETLSAACQAKEAAITLSKKLANRTTTPDTQTETPPASATETDDATDEETETDNEADEKAKVCARYYKSALEAYREKKYREARLDLLEARENCSDNTRVNTLMNRVEMAINAQNATSPNDNRPIARFFLRFDKAYLVHSVTNNSTQVTAHNPLTYGEDWQVKKLKNYLFHIKQKQWNGFFWAVNTSRKEVYLVRDGQFGSLGGTQNKRNIKVEPYPNGSNPTRFQLFFDNFYIVHAPPSTTQVTADGLVLQRENNWDIKKLGNQLYHFKNKAWKTNLFWKVDLKEEQVSMFRGTSSFENANATSNEKVATKVEVVYR